MGEDQPAHDPERRHADERADTEGAEGPGAGEATGDVASGLDDDDIVTEDLDADEVAKHTTGGSLDGKGNDVLS